MTPHPVHPRADHYVETAREAAVIERSLVAARRDACHEVVAVLEKRLDELTASLGRTHRLVMQCLAG